VARGTRLVGAGLYHHVFNRGNDRHPIFKNDDDYRRYIRYLEIFSRKWKIEIIAFALMEWHIHLFVCDKSGELSSFIHVLHGKYARLYNIRYERTGHVFTDRFKNKIVDTITYGKWLSRYIHRQAVDAGLVEKAEDYQWTSYHHYLSTIKMPFVSTQTILEQFGETLQEQIAAYRIFLEDEEEGPVDWKQTEINTNPIIGNREFTKKIAQKVGFYGGESCDIHEILEKSCMEYGISIASIRDPLGRKERIIRRYIIEILNHKHG
jgi:putative transposase